MVGAGMMIGSVGGSWTRALAAGKGSPVAVRGGIPGLVLPGSHLATPTSAMSAISQWRPRSSQVPGGRMTEVTPVAPVPGIIHRPLSSTPFQLQLVHRTSANRVLVTCHADAWSLSVNRNQQQRPKTTLTLVLFDCS
jgi:hypothetical protein